MTMARDALREPVARAVMRPDDDALHHSFAPKKAVSARLSDDDRAGRDARRPELDALVEVEREVADAGAEVMTARPQEHHQPQLRERHAHVFPDAGKTLLGTQARVEEVKRPGGEGKHQQRPGQPMQDGHPAGQRQPDLEQDRGEAEVLRSLFFRGRAGHWIPGPPPGRADYSVAAQHPAAVK